MLTVIRGRIGSGKTQLLIDKIGKRIENREKSILLVPDTLTYNYEMRLCNQLKLHGFIDASVYSFNRFASDVLDYCGIRDRAFLDDSAKAMAMRFALARCKKDLTVFKSAASRKGFAQRCQNMISTLENCDYSPDDIDAVCGKLQKSILKDKLEDTNRLYREYNRVLDSGYTDNATRLFTAKNALKDYTPLKNAVVFIDGFDVFTSRMYSFIGELMKQADVVITVSSAGNKSDSPAYAIHENTYVRLINLARQNNIAIEEVKTAFENEAQSEEIRIIKDRFYAEPAIKAEGEHLNISLKTHKTVFDEITFAADTIARAVRFENKRYRDFAVLCNDVSNYSPIVQSIFARFEIPVFTNTKHNAVNHPVASYLFALLSCACYGLKADILSKLALSGFSCLDDGEVDKFLIGLKIYGVKDRELNKPLLRPNTDTAEFEAVRLKLAGEALAAADKLKKCKTAKALAACCYEILTENGIFDKVNGLVDEYEANASAESEEYAKSRWLTLSDITGQIWNRTIKLLDDMASLFALEEISLQEFILTLREGFDASPVSTIPVTVDCVTFGDLTAAREQSPDTVFVVGAAEGIIPAVHQDDRLVSPKESDILLTYNMELANTPTTEDDRMRYNIYSAFSCPKTRLYVSCPEHFADGTNAYISPVFQRFTRLFGITPVLETEDFLKSAVEKPLVKKQAFLGVAADRLNSPEAQALYNALEGYGGAPRLSGKETFITRETAKKLFSPDNTVSVSRIEAFGECPFKHFVRYGLKPEELKDYIPDALDTGTVYHRVLEGFVKKYYSKTAGKEVSDEECRDFATKNMAQAFGEVHFGAYTATSRQMLLNTRLTDVVCNALKDIRRQYGDFVLKATEMPLGKSTPVKYTIHTDFGDLILNGKIDRVDEAVRDGKTVVRVIDYKSSALNTSIEKLIEVGKKLQAFIYLDALTQPGSNKEKGGAYYYPIRAAGELKEPFKDGGAIEAVTEAAVNKASEIAGNMLSGNIRVTPQLDNNGGACTYCTYNSVCRFYQKTESDEEEE